MSRLRHTVKVVPRQQKPRPEDRTMMNVEARPQSFAYARGEEVLAHLARAQVYHIQGGGRLSDACRPSWTIAKVIGTRAGGRQPRYLLAFQHDGSECMCWVREGAIEGVC
jgi:hypothetical protein